MINEQSKGINIIGYIIDSDVGEELYDAKTNELKGFWYRQTNITVDNKGGFIGNGNCLITLI